MSDLKSLWARAVQKGEDLNEIPGLMGAYISGEKTVRVSGKPGWVHVRKGPDKSPTIALNLDAPTQFNVPIKLKWKNGILVVIGVDEGRAIVYGGGGLPGSVGPHTHRIGSGLEYELEALRFEIGRVKPSSGMVVYINPFRYAKDDGTIETWLGGTIDLTAYKPSTAGNHAWVLVGVDRSDNTAVAVKGTEYSYSTPLTIDLIDDITFTGYEPCAAVRVRQDDTTLANMDRYQDAHTWFTGAAAGGDVSGPASSTDNAIVRWDGAGGDTLQDSAPLIDDSGNLDMVGGEVQDYAEQVVTATVSSTPHAVDWGAGSLQELTLQTSPTLTFSNLAAGKSLTLTVIQDGTGSRTITWPTITWPNGTPTLQTAGSAKDYLTFYVENDGATVIGWHLNAASSGHTIQDDGSDETDRSNLNFVDGEGVDIAVADDAGNDATTVTPALDFAGLTEELDIDGVNDEASFYDNSAGAHRKVPPWRFQSSERMIYAATADKEVVDTTSETTLLGAGSGTLTIPANSLIAGSVITVYARGQLGDTGAPTLELEAFLGSTQICTSGAVTLSGITDVEWQIEVTITIRSIGASGVAVGGGLFDYDDGTEFSLSSGTDIAVDTTGALIVDLRATWGTASASNTILAREAHVCIKNPPPGSVTPTGGAWTVGTSTVGGTDAIS